MNAKSNNNVTALLKTSTNLPGGVNLKANVLPLRRCDDASHQRLKQLLEISSTIHLHRYRQAGVNQSFKWQKLNRSSTGQNL